MLNFFSCFCVSYFLNHDNVVAAVLSCVCTHQIDLDVARHMVPDQSLSFGLEQRPPCDRPQICCHFDTLENLRCITLLLLCKCKMVFWLTYSFLKCISNQTILLGSHLQFRCDGIKGWIDVSYVIKQGVDRFTLFYVCNSNRRIIIKHKGCPTLFDLYFFLFLGRCTVTTVAAMEVRELFRSLA